MKAVVIERFGGEDQLKLAELPVPFPHATEVLIRVEYAAVNPVDWKIREGMMREILPHRFPIVLGWDAAGIVQALGPKVSHFQVGDRVYAYGRKPEIHDGTYAEYISLDERKVALMPKNLGFREAASIPLAGLTAWQSLFDIARFKKGETLMVQGGAGGVGGFVIQFARAKGASAIFATARERHHSYLLSVGADIVIDYSKTDPETVVKQRAPHGVDVVIDLVGGDTLDCSFRLLRPGGRLVSTVQEPSRELTSRHNVRAQGMLVEGNGRQLEEIAKLIERGKVKPPVIEEYGLSDVALAHKKSKSHHVEGKLVIKVH